MSAKQEIKFRGSLSPIMSAIKIGSDLMRISIDVPRSDLQKAIGLTALEGVALKFIISVDDNPHATEKPEKIKKEKPAPKPKGEFGQYWHILIGKNSIFNHPDLQSALPMDMGSFDESHWTGYKDCLKCVLEVNSLSDVSPERFEAWLEDKGLFSIITISRQAQKRT